MQQQRKNKKYLSFSQSNPLSFSGIKPKLENLNNKGLFDNDKGKVCIGRNITPYTRTKIPTYAFDSDDEYNNNELSQLNSPNLTRIKRARASPQKNTLTRHIIDKMPNDIASHFNELFEGIEPIFNNESNNYNNILQNQYEMMLIQCRQSNLLFIDDIGYENQLQPIYNLIDKLSNEEIYKQFEDSFSLYQLTMKNKTNSIVTVDYKRQEIILQQLKGNKKKKRIPMAEISEIRFGIKNKVFERNKINIGDDLPISLYFSSTRDHIDLLIPTLEKDKFNLWICSLINIISLYKTENDAETSLISLLWNILPKNPNDSSKTKAKTLSKIIKDLDLQITSKHAQKQVLVSKFNNGASYDDIKSIILSLLERTELYSIFLKYAIYNQKYLTINEFLLFLKEEQGITQYNNDNIQILLSQFKDIENTKDFDLNSCKIYKQEFIDYISSNINSIFNPFMSTVYQNMTYPLTDYFIYSSHNTYLEGNQLSGYSSSDMYARVLKAGCRCVELDCWNGDNGEPIIFHGHTLTSRILFKDVVEIIADYAFFSSPYPVILSLENHCNIEQQSKMAKYMIDSFGNSIAKPLWMKESNKKLKYLPSPNDLKRKIIIKGKVSGLFSMIPNSNQVAPELEGITYLISESCSNIKEFIEHPNRKPWHICSFVETRVNSLNIPNEDFIEFNKTNFSRIYPKGSRVESSNYKPYKWWCSGSQLVALNLQTKGRVTFTNSGLFKDNGGCGYILKPFYMLSNYQYQYNPVSPIPFNQCHIKITIINARNLPKPSYRRKGESCSPHIKICIYGHNEDISEKDTPTVSGNAFTPQWNSTLEFDIIMPELAIITFIVRDVISIIGNKTKNLAYYSLPFACIQKGYHTIPLYTTSSVKIPMCSLLCHTEITF